MDGRLNRRWDGTGGTSARAAAPPTALRGRWLVAARAVWILAAALIAGLSVAALPAAHSVYGTLCGAGVECGTYWRLAPGDVPALREIGISAASYATYKLATEVVYMLGFWAVAAVIFLRRSDDWLALFFSLMLVAVGALNAVGESATLHPALGALGAAIGFFAYTAFFVSFYVFPDGRLVPGWGRWPIALWALYVAALLFVPGSSPLHPSSWPPLLSAPLAVGLLGTMVFAQVYRYRRDSGAVGRQQTKWVVFGLAAAVVGSVLAALPMMTSPELLQPGVPKVLNSIFVTTVSNLALLAIPASLGVAILRYRLWDIDVIINRALVYGGLTASVVALYVLVVGSLGSLLQARGNLLVSLLATGIVAVLFAPLRDRLQRWVNRLMYGERDEPYAVLSRLGRRLDAALEPGAVLPTIVETVAGALRLPYVAISIKREGGFEVAASHGTPTGEQTVLPLSHGGEVVGELVLAPRTPGEPFGAADRHLLEDLARNAGVAVRAVGLTADLRRSRERLISAREEERRRLRRDLHDGLGPTLASLALGLDVSMKLLKADETLEAGEMLSHLKTQTKDAVVDIRRLVYGLRPPALDDLGLVAAIREQAANHGRLAGQPAATRGGRANGLEFSVEAPDTLPPLPAAVEVAAYRIAQEAMTNVARHAGADLCRVRLSVDAARNELRVEVSDDGAGLREDARAGVGMNSMRERAEELGGALAVEAAPGGGTRVLARLPLFDEGAE